MEQIYTIPVNEAFEECAADPSLGCPLCRLYQILEDDELDRILGAAMMEPSVRIETNREGFCRTHYDMMFVRQNRLGMALTLESHIAQLSKEIKDIPLAAAGKRAQKRIGELEGTCYVCRRVESQWTHMLETVVLLWSRDEDFPAKLKSQPYFCLPHYEKLLTYAQNRLGRKDSAAFAADCGEIVEKYMAKLGEDVSWFCKKFDYRFSDEPWRDSKDAIERAMRFLRSDLHAAPGTIKRRDNGGLR